jgi:hypothetical protein
LVNGPPGEKQNSWTGKRSLLKQQGFGFLVLFNGRLDAGLKGKNATALGAMDGKSAVTKAAEEQRFAQASRGRPRPRTAYIRHSHQRPVLHWHSAEECFEPWRSENARWAVHQVTISDPPAAF